MDGLFNSLDKNHLNWINCEATLYAPYTPIMPFPSIMLAHGGNDWEREQQGEERESWSTTFLSTNHCSPFHVSPKNTGP